jgi:hypothetical protein
VVVALVSPHLDGDCFRETTRLSGCARARRRAIGDRNAGIGLCDGHILEHEGRAAGFWLPVWKRDGGGAYGRVQQWVFRQSTARQCP